MAGTIVIDKNLGVAMSSIAFDYLVEKIRPYLVGAETAIREEIYRPVDEGGMSFISLREQGVIGFNAFLRAADTAFAREGVGNPNSLFTSIWMELFDALRADSRAR